MKKNKFTLFATSFFVFLFFTNFAYAKDITWVGKGGSNHEWSNCKNWYNNECPGDDDVALFNSISHGQKLPDMAISIADSDFMGSIGGVRIESDFGGQIRVNSDLTVGTQGVIVGGGQFIVGLEKTLTINGELKKQMGALFMAGNGEVFVNGYKLTLDDKNNLFDSTTNLSITGNAINSAQTASVIGSTINTSDNSSVNTELTDLQILTKNKLTDSFGDIPLMVDIARCESNYTHFSNGGILYGGTDNRFIGVFQIDETLHRNNAIARGWELNTIEGNIAYARFLYQTQGTAPWASSHYCWQVSGAPVQATYTNHVALPTPSIANMPIAISTPASTYTIDMEIGTVHNEVNILQKWLNSNGFKIAESGAGSAGSETFKFGSLTSSAVQKFQCKYDVVCDGTPNTTGYGSVGYRTRLKLNELAGSFAGGTNNNLQTAYTNVSVQNNNTTSLNGALSSNIKMLIASLQSQIDVLQNKVNSINSDLNSLRSSMTQIANALNNL